MATIRINRGKWQAIVRRTGFPQQSKTFENKSEARRWAYQKEAELNAGTACLNLHALSKTTILDLLKRYRETVTTNKKGHASESKRIDSFLKQPWANLSLTRATPAIFSHYRDQRLKQVQPATVRRDLGLLRAIFEVARQEWDFPMSDNPIASVKRPKEPAARNRRLKPGELDLLVKASEGCRERWLPRLDIAIGVFTVVRGQ